MGNLYGGLSACKGVNQSGPVDKSAIGYSLELCPMAFRVLWRLTLGCFWGIRMSMSSMSLWNFSRSLCASPMCKIYGSCGPYRTLRMRWRRLWPSGMGPAHPHPPYPGLRRFGGASHPFRRFPEQAVGAEKNCPSAVEMGVFPPSATAADLAMLPTQVFFCGADPVMRFLDFHNFEVRETASPSLLLAIHG